MNSEISADIEALLKNLDGIAHFPLKSGLLHAKIMGTFLDTLDETDCDRLSNGVDILVSISKFEGDICLMCCLDCDSLTHKLEITLRDFTKTEAATLSKLLSDLVDEFQRSTSHKPTVVIRKALNGMYNIHQTMQKLNVSEVWLKDTIPCSNYTWLEVKGRKEITGYFWSTELVKKLASIKTEKEHIPHSKVDFTQNDLMYIAEECCDGDAKWAAEILLHFIGYNKIKATNKREAIAGVVNRPTAVITKALINSRVKNGTGKKSK